MVLWAAVLSAAIAGLLVRPHAVSNDAPPLDEHAAPSLPALGAFDTIELGSARAAVGEAEPVVRAHRQVTLLGWAIPAKPAWTAVGIEASRDGGTWYAGRYGLQRPDVARALGRPDATTAGFAVPIDTGPPGMHVITLDLLLSNGSRTPLGRHLRLRVVR